MRFTRHERPIAHPRRDIVKKTADGPVFFLVDLEHYTGAVYVQEQHIVEMARSIGMLTVEEAAKLYETIDTLKKERDALPSAVEELKNGVDSAVNRFYSGIGDGVAIPARAAETPAKPAPKSEPAAIKANGPDSGEGRNSVSADTGDGSILDLI